MDYSSCRLSPPVLEGGPQAVSVVFGLCRFCNNVEATCCGQEHRLRTVCGVYHLLSGLGSRRRAQPKAPIGTSTAASWSVENLACTPVMSLATMRCSREHDSALM